MKLSVAASGRPFGGLHARIHQLEITRRREHQRGVGVGHRTQALRQPAQRVHGGENLPAHLTQQELLVDALLEVLRREAHAVPLVREADAPTGRTVALALPTPDALTEVLHEVTRRGLGVVGDHDAFLGAQDDRRELVLLLPETDMAGL